MVTTISTVPHIWKLLREWTLKSLVIKKIVTIYGDEWKLDLCDHFAVHTNIKSCGTPQSNIMLYDDCTSIK